MTSAITLASQAQNNSDSSCKYSLELAVLSLKFFQFNNAERLEFAKKIIKKSKLYLHSIKYYSDEDFNKFYGTLKSIMKTLLPKFCHFEFCSYFLFNIDHLKNLDYSKGMSLFQQLKKTTQLFMILSNFSLSVRKNFDSLLNFFFISPLENTNENCEIIHKCIRCDGQKEKLLFLLISIIFHHGIQYWWKLFEDDWSVKVSSEMLKKFITKILELLNLFHR